MPAFRGLVAAAFTPFHENGELNIELIPALVDHLERAGVAGIYAVGSTGEGVSLAIDERMAVAEAYLEAAKGRLPVFVQVGHDSLKESCRLASHAQRCGAQALSATCPTYFKIQSVDLLVDCVAEVAAAAPDLPFYYYHVPALTGASLSIVEFLQRGAARIPSLRGIKFTSTDLHEYQACLECDAGRFDILYGRDEMLLSALAVGGQGAVGSTYNILTPIFSQVLACVAQGDWDAARRHQSRATAIINTLLKYDVLPALKASMKWIGLDCGPCRLPLKRLSPEDSRRLERDLKQLGALPFETNGSPNNPISNTVTR